MKDDERSIELTDSDLKTIASYLMKMGIVQMVADHLSTRKRNKGSSIDGKESDFLSVSDPAGESGDPRVPQLERDLRGLAQKIKLDERGRQRRGRKVVPKKSLL